MGKACVQLCLAHVDTYTNLMDLPVCELIELIKMVREVNRENGQRVKNNYKDRR